MARRILTAVPLAVLALWLVMQRHEWPFVVALIIVVELALHEFFGLAARAGVASYRWVGYAGAAALGLAQVAMLHGAKPRLPLAILVVVLAVALAGLFAHPGRDHTGTGPTEVLTASSATLFGIIYVAFTLSWLIPLRFSDPATGRALTLMLFLLIWGSDISAYLVGRRFGRRFPFPRISPRKTVEGSTAGVIGAILVGGLYARFYWMARSWIMVVILAAATGAAGQIGDLIESAMKREANMKDSGHLLPGHGGMLDRIDSLIFAAPVFYLLWEFRRIWGI